MPRRGTDKGSCTKTHGAAQGALDANLNIASEAEGKAPSEWAGKAGPPTAHASGGRHKHEQTEACQKQLQEAGSA